MVPLLVLSLREESDASLGHFIGCIHIGHELGEGAGDGAGPDPCLQVNLPSPENPVDNQKKPRSI
jgi:hypothetical protein